MFVNKEVMVICPTSGASPCISRVLSNDVVQRSQNISETVEAKLIKLGI